MFPETYCHLRTPCCFQRVRRKFPPGSENMKEQSYGSIIRSVSEKQATVPQLNLVLALRQQTSFKGGMTEEISHLLLTPHSLSKFSHTPPDDVTDGCVQRTCVFIGDYKGWTGGVHLQVHAMWSWRWRDPNVAGRPDGTHKKPESEKGIGPHSPQDTNERRLCGNLSRCSRIIEAKQYTPKKSHGD